MKAERDVCTARPYDANDLSLASVCVHDAASGKRSFRRCCGTKRPVRWHPPGEDALLPAPEDRGYWARHRRDDIVTVRPQQRRVSCPARG